MTDPIADIIGDYRAFAALQRDRLVARGIDIAPVPAQPPRRPRPRVGPVRPPADPPRAPRDREPRERLERTADLQDPARRAARGPRRDVGPLIELIPPVHQRVYKMGLEHLGVVVGEEVDAFSRLHRAALTGQQFQSADNEPYYVLFEDFTHVKFYRRSLRSEIEGGQDVRRLRPRRRLGPAAARDGDRPEPAAALTNPPEKIIQSFQNGSRDSLPSSCRRS